MELKLGPAIKLCHQIERVKVAFYAQYANWPHPLPGCLPGRRMPRLRSQEVSRTGTSVFKPRRVWWCIQQVSTRGPPPPTSLLDISVFAEHLSPQQWPCRVWVTAYTPRVWTCISVDHTPSFSRPKPGSFPSQGPCFRNPGAGDVFSVVTREEVFRWLHCHCIPSVSIGAAFRSICVAVTAVWSGGGSFLTHGSGRCFGWQRKRDSACWAVKEEGACHGGAAGVQGAFGEEACLPSCVEPSRSPTFWITATRWERGILPCALKAELRSGEQGRGTLGQAADTPAPPERGHCPRSPGEVPSEPQLGHPHRGMRAPGSARDWPRHLGWRWITLDLLPVKWQVWTLMIWREHGSPCPQPAPAVRWESGLARMRQREWLCNACSPPCLWFT